MQHKDKLSDAERVARRKEATARYREKNRDKCREASRSCQAKRRLDSESVRSADKAYKQTEKYKAQQVEYRAANRGKLHNSTMAWRAANRERFEEYQREYRRINDGAIYRRISKWRFENADRERARMSKWAKDHPDLRRLSSSSRRAKMRNQIGVVSRVIVQKLMLLQRGRCAVCKTNLSKSGNHVDHVMPIKLGGLHADENMQLLCPSCNLSKNAKHPVDFMQKKGYLL